MIKNKNIIIIIIIIIIVFILSLTTLLLGLKQNNNKDLQKKSVSETYNITYHLDGGTISEPEKFATYTSGQEFLFPDGNSIPRDGLKPEIYKNGCIFGGWFLDSEFTNGMWGGLSETYTGDVEVYVKWYKLWKSKTDPDPMSLYTAGNGECTPEKRTITFEITSSDPNEQTIGTAGITDQYDAVKDMSHLYNVTPYTVGYWCTITIPDFIFKKTLDYDNMELYYKIAIPQPIFGTITIRSWRDVRVVGASLLH